MAQDIVSDALNQIMNSRKIEKMEVVIRRHSKVLIGILDIMKKKGHIDYELKEGVLTVKIIKLNKCRAVKPRYYVGVYDLDKFLRRFLPSRKFGSLVISTNKGLLDQEEVLKKNAGGSIIAYFY
jgi:ribosomal protein S8